METNFSLGFSFSVVDNRLVINGHLNGEAQHGINLSCHTDVWKRNKRELQMSIFNQMRDLMDNFTNIIERWEKDDERLD